MGGMHTDRDYLSSHTSGPSLLDSARAPVPCWTSPGSSVLVPGRLRGGGGGGLSRNEGELSQAARPNVVGAPAVPKQQNLRPKAAVPYPRRFACHTSGASVVSKRRRPPPQCAGHAGGPNAAQAPAPRRRGVSCVCEWGMKVCVCVGSMRTSTVLRVTLCCTGGGGRVDHCVFLWVGCSPGLLLTTRHRVGAGVHTGRGGPPSPAPSP